MGHAGHLHVVSAIRIRPVGVLPADDPDTMALRIHSHMFGLGGAISAFEGSSNHRLIFAVTPVKDGSSTMFYSIWWPKIEDETSDVPPLAVPLGAYAHAS